MKHGITIALALTAATAYAQDPLPATDLYDPLLASIQRGEHDLTPAEASHAIHSWKKPAPAVTLEIAPKEFAVKVDVTALIEEDDEMIGCQDPVDVADPEPERAKGFFGRSKQLVGNAVSATGDFVQAHPWISAAGVALAGHEAGIWDLDGSSKNRSPNIAAGTVPPAGSVIVTDNNAPVYITQVYVLNSPYASSNGDGAQGSQPISNSGGDLISER